MKTKYHQYIYGDDKGDNRYEKILSVIREYLCVQKGLEYGGVAFYQYEKGKQPTMRVFPLNPAVIDKNFPDDEALRTMYLKRINSSRPYNYLYHLKHFRTHHSQSSHFIMKADEKNILFHNLEYIMQKHGWRDFLKINDDPNLLDQLFFETCQKNFRAIPIPILTSPAILLVLPQGALEKESQDIHTLSEFVNFHMFNKLLFEIEKDVDITEVDTVQDLAEEFMKQLSEICIPISYLINGNRELCFDWFEGQEDCCMIEIGINLKGIEATVTLPTYCWFSENEVLINELPHYGIKQEMVIQTIENIYNLVHSNWIKTNEMESNVYSRILKEISDTGFNKKGIRRNVDSLSKLLEKIEDIESEQFKLINSGFGYYLNALIKTDKTYKLIFDKDIVVEREHEKWKGLKDLFHVLMTCEYRRQSSGGYLYVPAEEMPSYQEFKDKSLNIADDETRNTEQITEDELAEYLTDLMRNSKSIHEALQNISDEFIIDYKQLESEKERFANTLVIFKEDISAKSFISSLPSCVKLAKELLHCDRLKKSNSLFSRAAAINSTLDILHTAYLIAYPVIYQDSYDLWLDDDRINYLRKQKAFQNIETEVRDKIKKNLVNACDYFIITNKAIPETTRDLIKQNFIDSGLYPIKGHRGDNTKFKYAQRDLAPENIIQWKILGYNS